MPETSDTAREIINIKRDIREIKQAQEVSLHFNRDKYERLVADTLAGNATRVRVFLEVDGLKSRKEIQEKVGGTQPTVWRAIDHLEKNGLIYDLEETKGGSPIYAKPQWAKTLRIDDYVREHFAIPLNKESENESQPGNSSNQ
jgi:DNA-binding transcriptional ArsR family regulator